jgi:hypothetical protein
MRLITYLKSLQLNRSFVVCLADTSSRVDERSAKQSQCGGFALVIALSSMSFIILLILSLITFISVEVQVSSNSQERLKARENAYLGMLVALGNLQKYAGADQRSTARADIMADGNQFWTGVWHSNPNEVGYDASAWPVWLVSGNQTLSLNDPSSAVNPNDPNVVEIIPSLLSAPAVLVEKLEIQSSSGEGRYAYWVGDEGVKAKFNKSDPYSFATNPTTDGRRIIVAQRNGIEVVVPAFPFYDSKVDRLMGFGQFENLTGVSIDNYYHDFTASSYALLTDPVNGGLKQDLTTVFQAETLPTPFSQNVVFVTPDASIYGPRWEFLSDYYHAYELINQDGSLYPRPPFDSSPTRRGALDTGSGNSNAIDPYINIASEADVNGWVKHPYFALTTELSLVLSVSSAIDGLPVIRIHPFVELTNPYNITMAGGWYEYQINSFDPTMKLTFTSSSDPNAPALEISRTFMEYLSSDIPSGNLMRMLIHADQSEIEPGRSIRFFSDGIFDATNISSYIDTEMPMTVATDLDNWDSGYLEIQTKEDSGARWPDAVAFSAYDYDTLSIDVSFADSVDRLTLTFFLQRNTPGITQDSAITKGNAYVRNINQDNNYSFVMNWPADRSISQSFALVRGILKSEDEYDSADRSDFLGVFNPRSPLINIRHGDSSDVSVRAWDWTFELGSVNPNFSTPGGKDSGYGYWGPSNTVGEYGGFGATRTVIFDLPREPMISLGQFQNTLLSLYPHEPCYAFGNSYAPKSGLLKTDWYGNYPLVINGKTYYSKLLDVSYAMNSALWDRFYFSSIPEGIQVDDLSEPLASSHLEIHSGLTGGDLLTELQTYDQAAAHLRMNGGFNINSVSETAWAAILGSMAGLSVEDQVNEDAHIVENAFLRNASPFNAAGDEWSGFNDVSTDEIFNLDPATQTLAKSIVAEIKNRVRSTGQGRPFTSLSEFINRRLSNDDFGEMGTLQKAIEDSNINSGSNAFAPGSATQADILSALGPKLTSRSDTFVIRGYGESVSSVTGETVATAMCEVIVERQIEYINPSEGEDGNLSSASLNELTTLNLQFGRSFEVTSFRWIN